MEHTHFPTGRRLALAFALTGLVLAAEFIGGLWTGSLALLSDSGHVALDAFALGLSFVALRLATRPADARHTFGFHRLQVLAALANGATLIVMALVIFREAWERWRVAEPVLAGPMLAIAALGLAVNVVVLRVLSGHDHADLNVRSAFLHVLGDTVSSVGVIVAAGVILLTGWLWVDPLTSAFIGLIILLSALRVLRAAVHILVEGTPEHVQAGEVARAIEQASGVAGIHDLHVWTVASGYVALSAHVVLSDPTTVQAQSVQQEVRRILAERFDIRHSTIQIESDDCGQCPMNLAGWPG